MSFQPDGINFEYFKLRLCVLKKFWFEIYIDIFLCIYIYSISFKVKHFNIIQDLSLDINRL